MPDDRTSIRTPVSPEDVLADGVESANFNGTVARKGTVAAFVANAALLDELPDDSPDRPHVLDQLRALLPGLRAVGVLDVFTPRSPEISALVDEAGQPGTQMAD